MHSKKSESKMPCHVMCSEPGLKKGHTTGLVNCYWAILGPQRVVRRPACLPLPTTASGSLADTRSLPWLSLCTFWTRGAGRGRARQDLSAAAPPVTGSKSYLHLSSRQKQLPFLQPFPQKDTHRDGN